MQCRKKFSHVFGTWNGNIDTSLPWFEFGIDWEVILRIQVLNWRYTPCQNEVLHLKCLYSCATSGRLSSWFSRNGVHPRQLWLEKYMPGNGWQEELHFKHFMNIFQTIGPQLRSSLLKNKMVSFQQGTVSTVNIWTYETREFTCFVLCFRHHGCWSKWSSNSSRWIMSLRKESMFVYFPT